MARAKLVSFFRRWKHEFLETGSLHSVFFWLSSGESLSGQWLTRPKREMALQVYSARPCRFF